MRNETDRVRRCAGSPPTSRVCPACAGASFRVLFGGSDRLYRTTTRQFSVVECRECRLMRLYPWPEPAELCEYYPDSYWFAPEQELAGRWEETYRRVVLHDHIRFVERALRESGESGPIVDVGCGGGLFLHMLAERGHRGIGLDFSCDAAVIAWRRYGVPVVCGTLAHAPFAAGSCSAVTMFHVLEHLYDPVSYLESARELLRAGGRLVVQVPNAACWQFLLFGENWSGADIPRHLVDFRARDLEVLLDQCGFEVVRRKHFSLRDNPAGLATSIAPSLDPMARRIRRVPETPLRRLLKDLLYFSLVLACLPFTLLEAACGAGCTITVEARKKP